MIIVDAVAPCPFRERELREEPYRAEPTNIHDQLDWSLHINVQAKLRALRKFDM